MMWTLAFISSAQLTIAPALKDFRYCKSRVVRLLSWSKPLELVFRMTIHVFILRFWKFDTLGESECFVSLFETSFRFMSVSQDRKHPLRT